MAAAQPDKWDAFIDAIDRAPTLPEKFTLLATMVRTLATNDLSCMDGRIDGLSRKFETCMKKIYVVGLVIAVLIFTGVDIKTVVDLVFRMAK